MMGGAEIIVKGSNMVNDAPSNFPQYIVESYNNIVVPGVNLNDDDAFYSAPKNGRLAVRTPSLMDALSAQWSDFDGSGVLPAGHSDIVLRQEVINENHSNPSLQCGTSSKCKLKYRREYTPMLQDVIPNEIYAGQRVDFAFEINEVHKSAITPDDYFPVEELRIGRKNCDWEGLMDYRTRLSRYSLGRLSAFAGSPKPTEDATLSLRFRSGLSYNRQTSYHCTFDSSKCWYVRVTPKIESISAASGSTSGGQTLTLTGNGFDGTTVSVTADGVDCEVMTKSETELTCLTGANSAPTTISGTT